MLWIETESGATYTVDLGNKRFIRYSDTPVVNRRFPDNEWNWVDGILIGDVLTIWKEDRARTSTRITYVGEGPKGRLIGLVGTAGSGKDTVGQMLGYRRLAFADKLKRGVVEELGWTPEELEARKNHPAVRAMLQRMGDEYRAEDESVFLRELASQYDPYVDTVVTDVRYPREMDLIESLGGELWWVQRPGLETGSHASESGIAEAISGRPHLVVPNTGTLADLEAFVNEHR